MGSTLDPQCQDILLLPPGLVWGLHQLCLTLGSFYSSVWTVRLCGVKETKCPGAGALPSQHSWLWPRGICRHSCRREGPSRQLFGQFLDPPSKPCLETVKFLTSNNSQTSHKSHFSKEEMWDRCLYLSMISSPDDVQKPRTLWAKPLFLESENTIELILGPFSGLGFQPWPFF